MHSTPIDLTLMKGIWADWSYALNLLTNHVNYAFLKIFYNNSKKACHLPKYPYLVQNK